MKVFLFAILIFVSHATSLQAGYSFIHFEASKVGLSQDLFSRYVRPQIKALIGEYLVLLKKFGPLQTDFINLRQKIEEYSQDWHAWKPQCQSEIQDCAQDIRELHVKARDLDRELMLIRNSRLSLKENTDNLDNLLLLGQHLDSMIGYNYRLLHRLEEMQIAYKSGLTDLQNVYVATTPFIDKMKIFSDIIMFSALPKDFSQEFDTLWTQFISPLDDKVVHENSMHYLIHGLGELNMSWNTFHMRMTKSSLPQSHSNSMQIGIMHNRWTSIIRLIMSTYRDNFKGQEEKSGEEEFF